MITAVSYSCDEAIIYHDLVISNPHLSTYDYIQMLFDVKNNMVEKDRTGFYVHVIDFMCSLNNPDGNTSAFSDKDFKATLRKEVVLNNATDETFLQLLYDMITEKYLHILTKELTSAFIANSNVPANILEEIIIYNKYNCAYDAAAHPNLPPEKSIDLAYNDNRLFKHTKLDILAGVGKNPTATTEMLATLMANTFLPLPRKGKQNVAAHPNASPQILAQLVGPEMVGLRFTVDNNVLYAVSLNMNTSTETLEYLVSLGGQVGSNASDTLAGKE